MIRRLFNALRSRGEDPVDEHARTAEALLSSDPPLPMSAKDRADLTAMWAAPTVLPWIEVPVVPGLDDGWRRIDICVACWEHDDHDMCTDTGRCGCICNFEDDNPQGVEHR